MGWMRGTAQANWGARFRSVPFGAASIRGWSSTPSGNTIAEIRSGIPYPTAPPGVALLDPARVRAFRTSSASASGHAWRKSATTPPINAAAASDPTIVRRAAEDVADATVSPLPGATTSGLIRPSAVGPADENDRTWLSTSTAPTAITDGPSAGATSVREPG